MFLLILVKEGSFLRVLPSLPRIRLFISLFVKVCIFSILSTCKSHEILVTLSLLVRQRKGISSVYSTLNCLLILKWPSVPCDIFLETFSVRSISFTSLSPLFLCTFPLILTIVNPKVVVRRGVLMITLVFYNNDNLHHYHHRSECK